MTYVIQHHGVKGQKWGVIRRSAKSAGSSVYRNRGKIFIAATVAASGGLSLAVLNADPTSSVSSLSTGSNTDSTRTLAPNIEQLARLYSYRS